MPTTLTALIDPKQIEAIWPEFQKPEIKPHLPEGFPSSMAEFTLWLADSSTRAYVLGDDERPIGLFVLATIIPHDSAFAHVFIWDHKALPPAEIVAAAKVVCAAVMGAFDLYLVLGMTPTDNLPARLFLSRVGFTVLGTLPDAVPLPGGYRSAAWVSYMSRDNMKKALSAAGPESDTLKVTPVPEPATS